MNKLHSRVRVAELADTAMRIVELFKEETSLQGDTFLTETFSEISKMATGITEAMKSESVSSKLEEADKKRNAAIRGFDKVLKGYSVIPIPNLKEYGQTLEKVFRKYGVKITEENYSSKSNLIRALVRDFEDAKYADAVNALMGIKEAVANIKELQEDFSRKRAEYDRALVQRKIALSASEQRKPLLDLINKKLIPYLLAMEIANGKEYAGFVGRANEIIDSINDAIKSRSKKKEE